MIERFTPGSILKLSYLSEPAVCPGGGRIAYTVAAANAVGERFLPRIYEYTDGVNTLLCTDDSAKAPAYAPSVAYLAYLCDSSGEYQVWLQDIRTGKRRQVTHARHGVEDFCWSGDDGIFFTAKFWKTEEGVRFIEMTGEEKTAWLLEKDASPIYIDEIAYKNDSWYGVADGSVRHICRAGTQDDAEAVLTDGAYDCFRPAFSPETGKIAYYCNPYRGTERFSVELAVMNADGTEPKILTKAKALSDISPAVFLRDGGIAYIDMPPADSEGFIYHLLRCSTEDGTATDLFADQDAADCAGIDNMPAGRSVYGKPGSIFCAEGGYIWYTAAYHGRGMLYRVPEGGGASEVVISTDLSVHTFCAPEGGKIVFTAASREEPADLFEYDLKSGKITRLTHLNAWLEELEPGQVTELWADSDDGVKVQGWVMKPAGYEEGKKYSAVLDIHGGPNCCWTDEFWHEYRALSDAGMAVIFCNPRGSTGYGVSFCKDSWSSGVVSDLLHFLDAAAGLGFIDRGRIGVTGGSYGGYMTIKLIGTTSLFKAAAAQRPLVNLATSYGTGDIGFESAGGKDTGRTKMLQVLTDRARKSLIRFTDAIKVPVLLLHGYKDFRCSFEQSEQLFVALKERNPKLPVRLVMFPGENHGITRAGKPRNQVRHLLEITDWFVKYLAGEDKAYE